MLIYKVLQDNGKVEKSKVQTVCIIPTFGVKRGKKKSRIGFQIFLRDRGETCLHKRNY